MGLRLKYEGYNAFDEEIEVHIYDEDYSGSVIPFRMDLEDANLKVNGEAKNPMAVFAAGQFDFKLIVENSDHVSFFEALRHQQENRFFVHVYKKNKNAGSGVFEHIFIGYLVLDEVWLLNGETTILDLTASDGLNRLSKQEFKIPESGTPVNDPYGESTFYFQGEATIMELIIACMEFTGTKDRYPAASFGNNYLVVNHHWYEAGHPNTAVSPFDYIRVNHLVFTKRDDEGNYITTTCKEVLRNILVAFGCTMRYVFGTYYIENVAERGKDSKFVFEYDTSGTFLYKTANENWFHQLTHPFTDPTLPHPPKGGRFGHMPPLKAVELTFSYELSSFGYVPNYWSNDESTLINLGQLKVTSEVTSLFIGWGFEFIYSSTGTPSEYIDKSLIFWWGITVKWGLYYYVTTEEIIEVEDEDDQGNPITFEIVNYTNEWTTTPGIYLLRSDPPITNKSNITLLEKNEITLPPFESIDGVSVDDIEDLEIKVEFVKITTPDLQTEVTDLNVDWKTVGFYVSVLEDGERIDAQQIGVKYVGTVNDENSHVIEMNTVLGDAPFNSNNRLSIYDGAEWIPSTFSWGVDSTSGNQALQELLISEVAAMQASSIRRYKGTIIAMHDMRYFMKYDNSVFFPIGDFTMNLLWNAWSGEFVEVNRATPTITITTNGIQADSVGTLSTNVGTPTENPAEPTTQVIYPFKFEGTGSTVIPFGDIPLPTVSDFTKGQIEYLCVFYRNDLRMWYNEDTIQGYTINNADNELILHRKLHAGDYVRGHLIQIKN